MCTELVPKIVVYPVMELLEEDEWLEEELELLEEEPELWLLLLELERELEDELLEWLELLELLELEL